jgi:3-deoxy-manno-octulosonate cytidylyltransferase (CMP-KDO synthetase)
MRAVAVIPARIASTRLPRKILREIDGRTMLDRVYHAATAAPMLAEVIIATDSQEVIDLCNRKGWMACMTSDQHRSGTDRINEVAQIVEADVYINVQGDEPLARPEHLNALLDLMSDEKIQVGTLKTRCGADDVNNPNAVKVVTDRNGRALYFSRSTIPFDRDSRGDIVYFKHLGFYAYRKRTLERFCRWPESSLERSERLEQLRFLENGVDIHVAETPYDTIGVDTEADLKRVEEILRKQR